MAHPSQFMSRFVIPKSEYRMALNLADFRINFALNPGSTSGPPAVFLYMPDTIDQQLDKAARLYLEKASVTRKGSNEIVLTVPRICQWYLDDFGSSEDLVAKLSPLLKGEDRTVVEEALQSNVNVRYSDYSFKCRPLTLI